MSPNPRLARRLLAGASALLLTFGLTAFGATAASAAPGVDIAIVPGSPGNSSDFVEWNGLVYFSGFNGANEVLYRFDGTTSTQVLGGGDPRPSNVGNLAVYDNKVFFVGDGSSGNFVLYSWDGSVFDEVDPGVGDPTPINVSDLAIYNGKLFFSAISAIENVLYSWDGSVFDEVGPGPGPDPAPINVSDLAVYDNKLYFAGSDGAFFLYSWDGTVIDRLSDNVGDPTEPYDLHVHAGLLFFAGLIGSDFVLFSWNGIVFTEVTGGGDPPPTDVEDFITYDGVLYFSGDDGSDDYLYSWDGTNFTLIVGGTGSAPTPDDPESFVIYNNVLYFNGDGGVDDTLHSWDGSIFTRYAAPPFDMEDSIVYNGSLFFDAEDGDGLESIWSLRTAAGPVLPPTGFDPLLLVGIAGSVLLVGAGLLLLVRRRGAKQDR